MFPWGLNGDSHSYPQFPLSPQWGQYCTLRGCNLNRRRVIQCYTVTLWDFIVVVQYSLMAMLADERYIGEEKTIKIKKRRMKLSIERGVKNSVGTSESCWNLWFLLYIVPSRLDKKRFHMLATHMQTYTHTHPLCRAASFCVCSAREKKMHTMNTLILIIIII